MKSPRRDLAIFILSALTVFLSYGYILQCSPSEAKALEAEDGLIENAGAALFLLASLLAFYAFLRSGTRKNEEQKRHRNWVLLLLALLCFVAAGEEISWGQRIFGWETPAAIDELNMQSETNIHNLKWFHAKDERGAPKGLFARMLNATRLLAIFLLAFLVVVPLVAKMERFDKIIRALNVPVATWHPGTLLVMGWLTFRACIALAGGPESELSGAMNELKECIYALVLAVASAGFLDATISPSNKLND